MMAAVVCSSFVKENTAPLKGTKGDSKHTTAPARLRRWSRAPACHLKYREIRTADRGNRLRMKNTPLIDTAAADKDLNWAKINSSFQGPNPGESPTVILAHRCPVPGTVKSHQIARDLGMADGALTQERVFIA